uniref:Uncharacterized protein n=1 Tax=Arundo donax TaxID=35708 RepID=A0A0A9C8L5_ARUDO
MFTISFISFFFKVSPLFSLPICTSQSCLFD